MGAAMRAAGQGDCDRWGKEVECGESDDAI